MRFGAVPKTIIILVLLAGIVVSQFGYDTTKATLSAGLPSSFSPGFIRTVDMGFNSTVASFLWIATLPEILDIFNGKTEYLTDRAFVNKVDPKLTYPYAFSVLALPAIQNFPDAVQDAQAIGMEGLKNGDPDWRIPYYMALNYYTLLKDPKNALIYFDIAAHTPGVPAFEQRFAENFGSSGTDREKTEQLWTTIRDTTNDPSEKSRAQAYLNRLEILDYLEAASKIYKEKYGAYPTSTTALVTKGIIPEVPQDPFGYTFIIAPDGTAGVDLTAPIGN